MISCMSKSMRKIILPVGLIMSENTPLSTALQGYYEIFRN